jgi:hypothetical protein
MINQIRTFPLTAKLGLLFNPSRSQFEFLKKKYLILTNLETGPYKRGVENLGEKIFEKSYFVKIVIIINENHVKL